MANSFPKICCPISGKIIQQNDGIEGSFSTYLSSFEEIGPLGNGGFGLAVKCRHKIDGIIYVVKKIVLQQTEMSFEKIRREVEILGKISHPNIIRYYYSWVEAHTCGHHYDGYDDRPTHKADSPCLYIQMEFCPKKLSAYLMNVEIDMAKRLDFIRQLVDAVSHIHSLGIIHRDLSCENILLDEQFNIKIIDFGLAVVDGEMEHVHSNSNGTPLYRAPELIKGEHIDSKVDIFSLGVLFFEILNDWSTPHERGRKLDKLKLYESRSSLLNDLGARGLLIKDMLANDPIQRPLASQIQNMKPWMDGFEYMSIHAVTAEQTVIAEQALTDVGDIWNEAELE